MDWYVVMGTMVAWCLLEEVAWILWGVRVVGVLWSCRGLKMWQHAHSSAAAGAATAHPAQYT